MSLKRTPEERAAYKEDSRLYDTFLHEAATPEQKQLLQSMHLLARQMIDHRMHHKEQEPELTKDGQYRILARLHG